MQNEVVHNLSQCGGYAIQRANQRWQIIAFFVHYGCRALLIAFIDNVKPFFINVEHTEFLDRLYRRNIDSSKSFLRSEIKIIGKTTSAALREMTIELHPDSRDNLMAPPQMSIIHSHPGWQKTVGNMDSERLACVRVTICDLKDRGQKIISLTTPKDKSTLKCWKNVIILYLPGNKQKHNYEFFVKEKQDYQ